MHDRLFRALLRLLPEELRTAYARDMEATFRAERRDVARSGRRLALARLWLATLGDLLRHAPAEHWDVLSRDARYALRLMIRQPLHTLTAVAVLALGIGANVAMFAVVDAVLLAPLPYGNPDRVVIAQEQSEGREPGNVGYLTFLDLRARARSLGAMAATSQSFATLTGDGHEPERIGAMRVSASYFDVMGVRPAIGRTFTEAEDRPGAARRVAILSDTLWRRRFNADRSVVGRGITLSGTAYVVVGVMPGLFDDLIAKRLYGDAELWSPLGYDPAAAFACRGCRHLRVFGRLNERSDPADAERELSGILRALTLEHPTDYNKASARVQRLSDFFLGPVRPVLLVLWAGVAVLLLVACANVANLMLLRASERTHEVAVRAALGITRGRLARQLLTESLILAALGGMGALVPAWLAIRVAAVAGPGQLPRLANAALDARALAAAFGLTLASGVLFGLVPLRHLNRSSAATSMHGAGRRTDSAGAWRVRASLAAANVAMAAVLLVGAGLLVRTMAGLLAVAPGFDSSRVMTAQVELTGARYQAGGPQDQMAAVTRFYDDALRELRQLPIVERASATTTLPLGGGVDQYGLHVEGRLRANPAEAPMAHRFVVQTDFLETLRVPLVRGRLLQRQDGQGAPLVAVINRTAADHLFGAEDPIGHRIMLGPPDAPARTIVGVVGDLRHQGLDAPAGLQVYVPQAQWAWAEDTMTFVVRARGNGASLAPFVRRAVRHADAAQPVIRIRAYDDIVAESFGTRQFASWLLASFSVTAVLLAVVGLSGSLGVVVGFRRREIGIRLALGAGLAAVRRMILRQGMRPAIVGLALGLALASIASTALESLLFGVDARDPTTFAAAAALLLVAMLGACLIPAWRAGRVDPAATLRSE